MAGVQGGRLEAAEPEQAVSRISPWPHNAPPPSWFAQHSSTAWPVTHPSTVAAAFPRRPSTCDPALCSACSTPLRGRLSLQDDLLVNPPEASGNALRSQELGQAGPAFRSKGSGTVPKVRWYLPRRGTGLYAVTGGSLLILTLLALSWCERGLHDRGTYQSVWPLGHHAVDYEIEIEETWEFRNEVPRMHPMNNVLHHYPNLTHTLMKIARDYRVTSMLDFGCGSLSWQPEFLDDLSRAAVPFRYLGLDASLPTVQANRWQANFKDARRALQAGTMEFRALNVTQEPLPPGYELIFVHGSLGHMDLTHVLTVLDSFKHTDADFLLIDSHEEARGANRFQGLDHPPFNLMHPLATFAEETGNGTQQLLLYPAVVLRTLNFQQLREALEPVA